MLFHLYFFIYKMSTLTAERKSELLKIARHSHIRWVNEGNEKDIEISIRNQEKTPQTNDHVQRLKSDIPIADTIEDILVLFSEVIDDGNDIDFESILMFSELEDSHMHEDFTLTDDSQRIQEWAQSLDNTYINFIRKLRHPSVKEVINSMRQYVSKFEYRYRELGSVSHSGPPSPRQGEMSVIGAENWGYLENLLLQLRESVMWKDQSEVDFAKSKLYCEKFLHQKLYPAIQSFISAEDRASDQKLHKRIESLAFLLPEHLDLHMFSRVDYKSFLTRPISDLQRMMDAKSPLDKLEFLKCCTQSITTELNSLPGGQASGRGSNAGVDTFLPLMILAIKELNPPLLQCTINYIQDYAHPSHLTSEYGYLLTYFVSAVQFLETVDETALTISPHEFEKSIRRCKESAGLSQVKYQTEGAGLSSQLTSGDSAQRKALSGRDKYNASPAKVSGSNPVSSDAKEYTLFSTTRKSEIAGIVHKVNETSSDRAHLKSSEWKDTVVIGTHTLKLKESDYEDLYGQLLQQEGKAFQLSSDFANIKAGASIQSLWTR